MILRAASSFGRGSRQRRPSKKGPSADAEGSYRLRLPCVEGSDHANRLRSASPTRQSTVGLQKARSTRFMDNLSAPGCRGSWLANLVPGNCARGRSISNVHDRCRASVGMQLVGLFRCAKPGRSRSSRSPRLRRGGRSGWRRLGGRAVCRLEPTRVRAVRIRRHGGDRPSPRGATFAQKSGVPRAGMAGTFSQASPRYFCWFDDAAPRSHQSLVRIMLAPRDLDPVSSTQSWNSFRHGSGRVDPLALGPYGHGHADEGPSALEPRDLICRSSNLRPLKRRARSGTASCGHHFIAEEGRHGSH